MTTQKKNSSLLLFICLFTMLLFPTTSSATSDESPVAQNTEIGPGYYSKSFSNRTIRATPDIFLNQIKQGAIDGWKNYQILPSITAAQAILESGWGNSSLSQSANNLFGIKGRYNGQYILLPTQEYINGQWILVNAEFRKYPNWSASVEDHGKFFHDNSRYSNLIGIKDYKQVANLLKQDGYATDPEYPAKLISLIESNNLASWDSEAFKQSDYPHVAIDESIAVVNYIPGYGVFGFRSNGETILDSNLNLKHGTQWKTYGSKMINGEEMFSIGTDYYLPRRYTNLDASIITINYSPGYGVKSYRKDGSWTGNYLTTGTSFQTFGFEIINDKIMYLVGSNEYVPKQYTQFGNGK